MPVGLGVLQGSVLCPFLWTTSLTGKSTAFADDSRLVVGNRTKCKQVFTKSWNVYVKPQAHSAAQAEKVGILFPSTSTPARTMEYIGFIIDHTGISKRHIQAKVKKQRREEGH